MGQLIHRCWGIIAQMVSDQSTLLHHHENSQITRQQRPLLSTAHTGNAKSAATSS